MVTIKDQKVLAVDENGGEIVSVNECQPKCVEGLKVIAINGDKRG